MGFLSGITKSLFGGTDDTGIKEQQKANDRSQAYIREQTGQARGEAGQLYQQGDYARNLGINLAMALMGQSLPKQFSMLQGGQQDFQNAILGMQQAPSQYQVPSVPITQLPNFQSDVEHSAGARAGGKPAAGAADG
jgi:hypothetical protein